MSLAGDLESKRLLVVLGPGGVGKTTLSAALALAASKKRKTLVMTVDPARRLADAMGVGLATGEHQVTDGLSALMLDTKSALDALITKYAPSPEIRDRVFASDLYTHLSDAFAGSEEFVSVGMLDSILSEGRYGLVVVDTPPTKHAIDFLSASTRLVRVFESGVVKFILKPSRLLRLAGGRFADVAARWTSQAFLHEAAEFMRNFDEMFIDLEGRARRMDAVLRDPQETAYYLVTNPQREAIEASVQLEYAMARMGFKTSGLIVNRVIPRHDMAPLLRFAAGRGLAVLGLKGEAAAGFASAVGEAVGLHAKLVEEESRAMDLFDHSFSVKPVLVPDLGETIKDLRTLKRLARRLDDDAAD